MLKILALSTCTLVTSLGLANASRNSLPSDDDDFSFTYEERLLKTEKGRVRVMEKLENAARLYCRDAGRRGLEARRQEDACEAAIIRSVSAKLEKQASQMSSAAQ